ncbi:MAG: PLP-dependent aminotransferase family protein [Clostridium sp.]|nr:PLP-dependent aminotransferase family protein [Clostridium sp.]
MLTYSFTDIGSDSLYMHLYKCIKNDILEGKLCSGTKLPSKRSFAKNLALSNITVENAYAQLQAEGYIYSLPRKGFFVSDISNLEKSLSREEAIKHIARKNNLAQNMDLVSNKANPDYFPFSIWTKLMREVINKNDAELMTVSPAGGIFELRSAICNYLKEFRDMNVRPEQVIIGAGTEYLYGLIIQLLGYDKIYAVENPGYKKIAKVYNSNNVECKVVSLNKEGIDIKRLEEIEADVLHISPSHHYPTGIVTSIGRRYEVLGWASRKESNYIIEDDYDSEFRMTGKPIPTLQSIDMIEKVIYMNTFTKSLSPTIRISYMVLPYKLLDKFYSKLGFYSCTVSNFEQYTLAKFINEGYFEKHIIRMRNIYRNLRDRILDAIKKSRLNDYVKVSEEEAGLHFLLNIKTELSDKELKALAEKRGINISCISEYYFDDNIKNLEHTLIINYSSIRIEDIDKVINMLLECIK